MKPLRDDMWRGMAVTAELRHHLQERVDWLLKRGMSRREAEAEARRRFGDCRKVREQLDQLGDPGDGRWRRLLDGLLTLVIDLRLAARALRLAPGFSLAVIATVALGVGANAALFSLLDAVLLRPLPYASPETLVSLYPYDQEARRTHGWFEPRDADAWSSALAPGEAVFHGSMPFVRTDGAGGQSVIGRAVSPHWLGFLGAAPAHGRSTVNADALDSGTRAVMISDRMWRRDFAADPGAVGASLELDGVRHRIVGVMGPDFRFPTLLDVEVWLPLDPDNQVYGRTPERFEAVARRPLEEGLEQVEARWNARGQRLQDADPRDAGWAVEARSFGEFRANNDVRQALWVMMGAVVVMLAIATVNATNLLLVRAGERRRDIVLRKAIGASQWRLAQHALAETVVLLACGLAAALVLARGVLLLMLQWLPAEIVAFLVGRVEIDLRVVAFSFLAAGSVGLLLWLFPTLTTLRQDGLGARASSAGAPSTRLRDALVVAEIALSVGLLVSAGLVLKSFATLANVDPGYQPDRMVHLSVSLPETSFPAAEGRAAFYSALRQELAALGGVRTVSIASGVPPRSGFAFGLDLQAEGGPPKGFPGFWMPQTSVDPSFLEATGIELIAGRNFNAADAGGDNVIIDDPLARFLFGDRDPVGRRFRTKTDSDRWLTVVGVVADVKLMGRDDRDGNLDLFYALPSARLGNHMSFVLRVDRPTPELTETVRATIRKLDAQIPIRRLAAGTETLAASVDKPRFYVVMMTGFAVLAIALAAVGVYGVVSYAVRLRRHEFGVRAALGAQAHQVRRAVVTRGARTTALGAALGVGVALLGGRLAESLLFQVTPSDPTTLALGVAIVSIVAIGASWLPADRATRVNPIDVLRAQ